MAFNLTPFCPQQLTSLNLAICILHRDYLVDKMDLGQAKQNCTLNCTYDQLFVLYS
jgi:hypothetical protein